MIKMRSNRGSVSGMVVCLTLSAVSLCGLVFDGGNIVNTYSQLSDLAENSGRVGAQKISGIRAGNAHINQDEAITEMKMYLKNCACISNFQVEDTRVSVTLRRKVKIRILGIVGATSRNVTVSRTVEIVNG